VSSGSRTLIAGCGCFGRLHREGRRDGVKSGALFDDLDGDTLGMWRTAGRVRLAGAWSNSSFSPSASSHAAHSLTSADLHTGQAGARWPSELSRWRTLDPCELLAASGAAGALTGRMVTDQAPGDRLRTLLRDAFPHAYCYACLTAKMSVAESRVRDAAQILVLQPGFVMVDAACSICETAGRWVVYRPKPAE
jgi:hypothetical protein